MERNQEPTEEQLMKIAAVNDALIEEVMIPAFEKRCAECGIVFNNAEDRDAALETVAMLRLKEAQLKEQGVETNPSGFKAQRNLLKRAMAADLAAFEPSQPTQAPSRLRSAVASAIGI
jgi:hypothetical protein